MTGKGIAALIGFGLVLMSGFYFGFRAFEGLGELLETPGEDAYYEAHGCYISDGGNMYTCPNGNPPDPDANPEAFEAWERTQK